MTHAEPSFPPMATVTDHRAERVDRRQRRAIFAGTTVVAGALAATAVAISTGTFRFDVGGSPTDVVSFSNDVATHLGADFRQCPVPQVVRRYGDWGGYTYFGAVEWYAAVRWEVGGDAGIARIVNECLRMTAPYSASVWAALDPYGHGPTGWSAHEHPTVADDGLGRTSGQTFAQHTEKFGDHDENERIVYVRRAAGLAPASVDLYLSNWD